MGRAAHREQVISKEQEIGAAMEVCLSLGQCTEVQEHPGSCTEEFWGAGCGALLILWSP